MMSILKFHSQVARRLDPSDRPVYLFSVFAFYFPLAFMVLVVLLKLVDSLSLVSAPLVYAAPPLNFSFLETVPGWAYIALLIIGLNLHFKGLARLPKDHQTASIRRYLYYWDNGWFIANRLWTNFKKYPEIKTLLIYFALFLGLVYLYNSL